MKKILCIALVLIFAFGALAGCGSGGTNTTPSASPSASADGSASPSASGGAANGGTIKIGILGPLTGEAAQYGIAVSHGAQLYIDQINDAGGINGKKIETVVYDDKGDPTESVNAFSRMVDEGITGLIGPVTSKPTLAVVDEALTYNMPLITASATAAAVTYNADTQTVNTNVFRTCFIDPFQGEKMAQFANDVLKAKTAAVIFQTGDDYSVGLKDAFVAKCEELGINVVDQEGYSKGDKDFKSQLTNINSKSPDVVFSPNYYEDDGMLVTQARQAGIKATFMGGDGWNNVSKYASPADLEGSVYCSGYASGSTDEIKAFEAAFTAKYSGETPDMFSAQAYDAAIVLLDAIKAAEEKGLEAGSDDYKAAVIDAMKNTTSVGLGGKYSFDEYNNPIKSAVIMKLADGKETFSQMF
ncbi:branched-chain amino acid transport system substrate-binding protein [Sporobacter termitidis DSM 10068]|uniref:Branched-chain amino acid transport system substrate-binding protein n=1 Tax=Sporobacter termitidis DSM 10068 TaxID=1123282 RepID=A0A1M5Z692_9FIRM|nr:ABC transporter substrate-binding protein [Sporobacter termitidis]SHI19730.1 branched-chain amino acid transport system substrate-binding protein [Sporobacter termitidis DSM 10068]